MDQHYCEHEAQVVAALRGGEASPTILGHIRNCPLCSEVFLVTELLREETKLAAHELGVLPDGNLLWRKAQAAARQKAIARAALPIRLVRTCAYVVAVFVAPWLVFESRQGWSWIASNWIANSWRVHLQADSAWTTASTEVALLAGIAGTLICGLSSWYLLRQE